MDAESSGGLLPARLGEANANPSTETPPGNSRPLSPLAVERKTSPVPPMVPQPAEGTAPNLPDDDWDDALELALDEEDNEDERIMPLPRRAIDPYDEDPLAEDPFGTEMIQIEGTASDTYSSLRKLADTIQVDIHAIRGFILENTDVLEIAQYHTESYVKPQQDKAGDAKRGNAHPMDAVVGRILPFEDGTPGQGVCPYRAPSTSRLREFEPIDRVAYSVYRMHDRLNDEGLLDLRWDVRSRYRAAFLVLKARETLDQTERKLEQAISAHRKANQAAAGKRDSQLQRRTAHAATIAKQSALQDGRLPTPATSSIPRNDPAGADFQPIPDTADEIMDVLIEQSKHRQRSDQDEKARRDRASALGRLTLSDHIQRLINDPKRKEGYRAVQKCIREGVTDFFDDFTEVDVSDYRKACMAQFDVKKPSAQSIRANDITNPLSDAEKDKQKEALTANLSSQWAGEEARSLNTTADDRIDVDNTTDLPPPSKEYKDMARAWNKMINSLEYQDERLKAALTRCYITNINSMRVPFQNAAISLHWWQVICVAWMDNVMRRFGSETKVNGHTGWTKGGLVADEIGLGKTTEYAASILVVSSMRFFLPSSFTCSSWGSAASLPLDPHTLTVPVLTPLRTGHQGARRRLRRCPRRPET